MNLQKTSSRYVLCLLLVIGSLNAISGQRTVNVPNDQYLDKFIYGDTTTSGARVDTNTIYILERGQAYELFWSLRLRTPLQIKSAKGEGPPAMIFTREPCSIIRTYSDLYLEDMHLTGNRGEWHQALWGNVRTEGENTQIVLKNCFIEEDKGSALQIRNSGQSILIEDCVIGKLGDRNRHNSNGRLIDTRGYDVKKIEVRNTTLFHIVDRIICNHMGGTIETLIFDQNTGMQLQGYNGLFHLGRVGYAQITNNLFLNPKYMGDYSKLGWNVGAIADPDNIHYLITVDTILSNTEFHISNNNFYYDDEVLAYFEKYDSVNKPEILGPGIAEEMGDDALSAGWELSFEFINPIPTINFHYLDSLMLSPDIDPMPENWPMPNGMTIYDVSCKFISNNAELYNGSTTGGQIGNLRCKGIVGVESHLSDRESLTVYPCPSDGLLTFSITLENASDIDIAIYDLTGNIVKSDSKKYWPSGDNSLTLNIGDLPNSIYFYTFHKGDECISGKFILNK